MRPTGRIWQTLGQVTKASAHDRAPDDRALQAAARLFREFPPDEVEIYLATLVAMDPEVWGRLTKSLESRVGSGA